MTVDCTIMANCTDPMCVNAPTCMVINQQLCGNGTMDVGELCDDGNLIDGDGCDSNCLPTGCGNGIVTAGEACDDGNLTDGDGCDSNCTATACGNGIMTGGETCDDGNTVDGDGCDSNCRPTGCGNGVKAGTEQCDDGNAVNGDGCDNNCTITACGNGIVTAGEACDDGNTANWDGCSNACTASAFTYAKASNTNAGDSAGIAVALSADGSTLAVGAEAEQSAAIGINGNQADNTKTAAGAVYVFVHTGTVWTQQAYIKASNTDKGDHFGSALSLSADGSTLAVGAFGESSNSPTDQSSNAAATSGAVYVFGRGGTTWAQQAYLKASTITAGDRLGQSVALSGDGKTLAAGAVGNDKAYVYVRTGDMWAGQAMVSATDGAAIGQFGQSTALSTDGATLVVGANAESGTGAAYVFARAGDTWTQQGHLVATDAAALDDFGFSVAISGNGSIVAIGADEKTSATAANAGAVYVFTRTGAAWAQSAEVTSMHARGTALFGYSVSLSTDGKRLAIGAYGESSSATGVGGDESKTDATFSGAAYLFVNGGATWTQQSYVKATNTNASDLFGRSVSLSSDGSILAVGAPFEAGASTGLNGDQASNTANGAGAAYIYQ